MIKSWKIITKIRKMLEIIIKIRKINNNNQLVLIKKECSRVLKKNLNIYKLIKSNNSSSSRKILSMIIMKIITFKKINIRIIKIE